MRLIVQHESLAVDGAVPGRQRRELVRCQITFDDGSTTRERAAASRDGRRPRFALKAMRLREILGG